MGWGIALAALGTLAQVDSNLKAGKNAQRRSDMNAASISAEWNERIRKTKLSQQQDMGSALAGAGASGVSLKSKSVEGYLAAMKENFKKDIDWMQKAKKSGVGIEQQRGADARSGSKRAAWGALLSGAGAIVNRQK